MILAAVLALVWGALLLQTILNLRTVPRVVPRQRDAAARSVTVIIPARNEEAAIAGTAGAFLRQTHSPIDVIVVDDQSSDGTRTALRPLERDPRIRVIDGTVPPEGWLGKPWALQQGGKAARGDYLLFVDADVLYDPSAVAALVGWAEAHGNGLVSVFPDFRMEGFWEAVLMPQLAMSTFVALPLFLSERHGWRLFAVGSGSGNLIRRDLYESLGGHERIAGAVVDDVALARLVRRGGWRASLVDASKLVHLRMYQGPGEIIRGFSKNAYIVLGGSVGSFLLVVALFLSLHLIPFLWGGMLLVSGRVGGAGLSGWLVWCAVGLITLSRVILFARLRYPIWSAVVAYPLSIAGWVAILAHSAWRTGAGSVAWKGRQYRNATAFGRNPRGRRH